MCASGSGKKFLRLLFAGNLTVIELFINRELIKSKLQKYNLKTSCKNRF